MLDPMRVLRWVSQLTPESIATAGLSEQEASELVAKFREAFPHLRDWVDKVKTEADNG